MDYESAYKQALERAKSMMALPDDKAMIEEIFPELKESEDEKMANIIREALANVTSENTLGKYGLSHSDVSDWLEGEQKAKYHDVCDRCIRQPTCQSDCFLQQGEQKPAWSEEDDDNIMMIEDRFSDYLDYIREDSSLTKHRKNTLKEEVIGYVNWLKSLRPQNRWRPSDEQLYWIKWVAHRLPDTEKSNEAEAVLEELLEQLKKLGEE